MITGLIQQSKAAIVGRLELTGSHSEHLASCLMHLAMLPSCDELKQKVHSSFWTSRPLLSVWLTHDSRTKSQLVFLLQGFTPVMPCAASFSSMFSDALVCFLFLFQDDGETCSFNIKYKGPV